MGLGDIADGIGRSFEALGDGISEALFEPVVRLGVTGLSRAGKTVFITSLVANLLERGRMNGLSAQAEGRILSAYLQPQPDDTVPRFDYETYLAALSGPDPRWPESTRAVSELRLSFRVAPAGMLAGLRSPRTVHLDIVDYPGEWLLDLALLDKSYAEWSAQTLTRIAPRPMAGEFLALADRAEADAKFSEGAAKELARAFTAYLVAAREAGFSDCTPGRFLLPGEMEGSPALTFAPLPMPGKRPARGALYREMERRFDAYKSRIVKPFFRDHFSRIDRQVVLMDVLGAVHSGPQALDDLRRAMADILAAFRPGQNAFLTQLFLGRRVEKILFAATKADHLHHRQHPALTGLSQAMMREAIGRAEFAGAEVSALSIAALRATTEARVEHDGRELDCVRGTLLNGKTAAMYPGELPDDPMALLAPAQDGAEAWLDGEFDVMRFAPSGAPNAAGDGPPHIRLDRAAEFLFGDQL
ncbi:MAG: hypothetical protein CR993_03850 [Rhodobacterales bacterium]|nr:MAG: hypothetical protein CR993_03850 [Rhodobacterales bacterium]